MYYYELHCHENVASRCGVWSPEELVKTYAELGYTGIVVSDHFFNGNCAIDNTLPWKERVEGFCLGYERAKEAGKAYGLDVFFAFEYTVNTHYKMDLSPLGREMASEVRKKNTLNGCDFLIYGLGKDWLLKKDENILRMSVNEFMKMVREEGGVVVQAHPFRLEKSYMDHISLFPEFTDGVEILNCNPNTLGVPNRMAAAYAKEYGFFATAGTDAHRITEYLAVTKLQKRAETMEELLQALKEGKAEFALVKNKKYVE